MPDHRSAAGRWYVVVSGPPASGKSTLARQLAPALGLPLLAKDTLKDGLLTVLDAADVGASQRLGRAAVAALLAVAGGWPVLTVDTSAAVDVPDLARQVLQARAQSRPGR